MAYNHRGVAMIFPKVRTIFQNSRRPHIHPACRWAFPLIFSKYISQGIITRRFVQTDIQM